MNKPNKIIIHHSATSDGLVLKDFDSIRNYHINVNKWRDIGYHWVIESVDNQYEILKGRDEKDDGAHCIGQNTSSIGICVVGDFTKQEPTEAQYQKIAELIKDIYSRYGELPIYGHKDLYSTSCPGKLNIEVIKKMLKSEHWAKKHLDSLVNKGIIDSPELWSNFDAMLSTKTIGELLGLIDKATGKISSVLQEEIKPQENNEIKHTETQKTESAKYYKVSLTDVVEIDPMTLKISIQDKPANKITLQNFVTSGYQMMQANGEAYPLGILVSEGKVIQNRQPHNLPAGTLIIYKDGKVDVKPVLDITQEKNVWFAVSGCSILPKIAMTEEGFFGQFSDIGRKCNRPVIGYNPIKNKIIVAVRPDSDISRGQLTLINLGCTKGITLDAGGSTVLRVNGEFKFNTTRQLYSVITW
jgi:exopolysaccharide biosynthesis protein